MSFSTNKKLFAVLSLEYLKRSESWRSLDENNQLLLNHLKLHRAVVQSTISGWVKTVSRNSRVYIS